MSTGTMNGSDVVNISTTKVYVHLVRSNPYLFLSMMRMKV